MKKLVVFYAGEWAERLLTIARCKDIAYFVDEEKTGVFSGGYLFVPSRDCGKNILTMS